jgi:hypothetical protein
MLRELRPPIAWLVISACIVLPILSVWIFSNWINEKYSHLEGVITALIVLFNAYLFLASLFYYRSERFYLFVQRQLLRFRRTHTRWKFVTHYKEVEAFKAGQNRIVEIGNLLSASFAKVFPKSKVTRKQSLNEIEIIVDDGDRFVFRLDHDHDEAYFVTSRMRVPSGIYVGYLRQNIHLLSEVEKQLSPKSVDYRLEIEFDRNPYFGFFLRNVPADLVKTFHCVFHTTVRAGASVEVWTNTVAVSTADCFALQEVATNYLALSSNTT